VAERQLLGRIACRGVDGDDASVLVYDLDGTLNLVATVEGNGDVEVLLTRTEGAALARLLKSGEEVKRE
jgi:hypothetical protein